MFEITLNGSTLYNPNSAECNITNAVIHEALNDSGYMDLTIPYSNPMYDEIVERKGKIIVYKDNVELWYGEVRDVSIDFNKNKSVYIIGEASYLNDTVQPQREITGTRFQIFEELINQHNAMVDEDKQFQVGIIGADADVSTTIVTDWEYTLDAIREHLCQEEEYFRIRHLNGVRYIDVMPLASYGKRSEQTIMFGDNLLDYAEESSGEKIATVCIPLGATLDDGGIDGYENYLTCEDANDGKNYVELPSAINRIGRITKVVHFNVLTDASALVTAAVNYLTSAQYASLTLKLSAVDLSILHSDIDSYAVGDYVRAICEPMGMDAWFPIRERETDLLNLSNNKITIGSEGTKSITAQNAESIDTLERAMPNRDSILNAALKNASNMINANGENGNVSIRLDDDGKPYEILIMDADSLTQSTRAWRWNLSGFGYGTKDAGASEFTWEADVAMTMDGEIVAKRGVIGSDASAWNIGSHAIYSGTDSASATSTNGMYVGIDGILNVADGTAGEKVFTRIQGGKLYSTSQIYGASVKAGVLTADSVVCDSISCSENIICSGTVYSNGYAVVNASNFSSWLDTYINSALNKVICGSGGKSWYSMDTGDILMRKNDN